MDTLSSEENLLGNDPLLQPPTPPTLSQQVLDFGNLPQGGCRTLQQVISNTNRQPMLWLAHTDASRWVTLEPDTGLLQPGEQQSIRVTVNTTSLDIGQYTATLTFSSEGDESSMSIDIVSTTIVEARVIPPAVGLNFGNILPHSTRTLELVINNPDKRTVKWHVHIGTGMKERIVEELQQSAGDEARGRKKRSGVQESIDINECGGVSLDRTSGTLQPHASQTIYVTVNADRLDAENIYTTTLTFTSEADESTSTSVHVPIVAYITVEPFHDSGPKPPPALPSNLSFDLLQLQNNQTTTFHFTNPSINGKVSWTLNTSVSWISLSPTSGTLSAGANALASVTASRGSLLPGIYHTDLVLTFNFDPLRSGHPSTPSLIPVTLVVH